MDDMELIGLDYVWRVGWALYGWCLVLGENVVPATIPPTPVHTFVRASAVFPATVVAALHFQGIR